MPKKALFIIARENYQDHEYAAPKKILEDAGIEVVTASKEIGACSGSFGSTTEAAVALADVDVSDYDAVVFIGGSGAVAYQHDVQAHLTAQEAVNRNKILAAICIGPAILAHAGVLEGKKATVWNEDNKKAKILVDNGAAFTNEPVTVDGNIITANGPQAAEKFGKAILDKLM
jgi:protease I